MSISTTANFTSISPLMIWATADTDIFARTHIANIATTLESHDHTLGKGVAAGRLNITNALTNPGDILITATTLTFKDSGGSSHTVPTFDGTNTWTGVNDFSGQTTVHSFKVPVLSSQNPTQNGALIYDSVSQTYKVGVNGTTQTVFTTGGGAVPVTLGGTGVTSIPANGVMLGEGTNAINTANPGSAGLPLASNGVGADPSFQQLGTAGISNGAITDPLIAAGTITGDKLADGTITGAKIANGTITADKLASGILGTQTASGSGPNSLSGTSWHQVTTQLTGLSPSTQYVVLATFTTHYNGGNGSTDNFGVASGSPASPTATGLSQGSNNDQFGIVMTTITTGPADTTISGYVQDTNFGNTYNVTGTQMVAFKA